MFVIVALFIAGIITHSPAGRSMPPPSVRMFKTPLPKNARPEFLERELIRGKVRTAFDAEDFAAIDAMAKSFLDLRAKTTAGTWKLGYINDEFAIQEMTDEYPFLHDERLIQKWIKIAPGSSTAHVAYAANVIDHGYFFRARSNNPSTADLRTFNRYIARARHILEDCRHICDNDPEWYMRMLQVAKIQDWNEKRFGRLFAEATDKFPDYQRIYFQGAEYYSPLYGRTPEDLDQFVQDAIGKTSKSEGTIFYARIYGFMAHLVGYRCSCMRIVYPRMYNALLEMNNRYRDIRNAHEFAWTACMAGDKTAMKMLLPEIAGPTPADVWNSQEIMDICKSWATDRRSPPGISPFVLPPPRREAKQTNSI